MESLLLLLQRGADAIDEADENTTYLGYCDKGTTGTDAATWSICKITKSANVTKIEWANGQRHSYNLVFDNRTSYTYTFRKF